jgi:hypothetical protein
MKVLTVVQETQIPLKMRQQVVAVQAQQVVMEQLQTQVVMVEMD